MNTYLIEYRTDFNDPNSYIVEVVCASSVKHALALGVPEMGKTSCVQTARINKLVLPAMPGVAVQKSEVTYTRIRSDGGEVTPWKKS